MKLTSIALCALVSVVGCKKKEDKAATPAAGSGSAVGSAVAVAPPPPSTGKFIGKIKGKDVSGTFDHQVVTDDGQGNVVFVLVANCPQIKNDCDVAKYTFENEDLLNKTCPGFQEIYLPINPDKQVANMGPITLKAGEYGKEPGGLKATMVEHKVKGDGGEYQLYPDGKWVKLTDVGATVSGSWSAKDGDNQLEGTFSAKRCKCDDAGNGLCAPV